MRTPLLATSLILSALAVLPACGGDTPPGQLVVPFVIGANVDCSVLGVEDVTVELVKPAGADFTVVASQTVACDAGQADFTGVAVGNYEVQVTGIDAENIVVVDNFDKDPADKAEVTSGSQNVIDDIELRPTPARVKVRWTLDAGADMCGDVPVADFEVRSFKGAGLSELLTHTFACDPVEERTPDKFYQVPDEGRRIEGDLLDLVTIEPLDASGNSLLEASADPIRFQFAPRGHGRSIDILIDVICAADTCTLSCPNPDPAAPDTNC